MSLNDVRIFLRVGPFKYDIGIVNSHNFQRTHWILYNRECYFDSYGCSPPQKLFRFIIKRNGHCLISEYKNQGLKSDKDLYCSAYCLYINYPIKVLGIDFKSAVLKLYYQRLSLHKRHYREKPLIIA